jgi:hypothetical protein
MLSQNIPTAAQKVNAFRDQLLQAYIQKAQAEQQIIALSNVIAGVTVGQQLQQEIANEAQVPQAPAQLIGK